MQKGILLTDGSEKDKKVNTPPPPPPQCASSLYVSSLLYQRVSSWRPPAVWHLKGRWVLLCNWRCSRPLVCLIKEKMRKTNYNVTFIYLLLCLSFQPPYTVYVSAESNAQHPSCFDGCVHGDSVKAAENNPLDLQLPAAKQSCIKSFSSFCHRYKIIRMTDTVREQQLVSKERSR